MSQLSAAALASPSPSARPRAAPPPPAQLELVEPAAPACEGRVLVCDDARTMRSFVRMVLEPRYQCVLVASAEEALREIDQRVPDVIVSDVNMEGMSGYALCEAVRQRAATRHVPIILMTTTSSDDARVRGLESGADDYLSKPLRPRELLARVRSLVRLRQANLALELRSQELEGANRRLSEAQAALVHSEKLATLGTLAAGIAHEVNNPLAFIKAGLGALQEFAAELAHPDPLQREQALGEFREIGREMQTGMERIHRIVRDLRQFAPSGEQAQEELLLSDELGRAWQMAAMRANKGIRLRLSCDPELRVRTVPHRFGQVVLNVMLNGVQAIGDRAGEVQVDVQVHDAEVHVRITDSGAGIPPELMDRIFDPFFTTKGPGQGTGLGLSVSYGVMRGLGGRIEACNTPGQGATFTVVLPR